MSMWEPFSEEGRGAIVRAQELAQQHGDPFISHHHIFAALTDVADVAQILSTLGADPERVRSAVAKVLGAETFRPMQEMTFTAESKRMIELGFENARRLDTRYIGAEHLALGYIDLGPDHMQIVTALQIDPEKFRQMLMASLERKPKQRVLGEEPLKTSGMPKGLLEESFAWVARRKIAELRPEGLWDALTGAAAEKNVGAAIAYGFLIARLNGWTADETAQRVLDAAKRRFDN